MNGTAFTSRDQAVSNFQSKYGNQYSNHFTSQPATRPSWVPQSTSVGGHTYNITYNSGYGGYGYYGPGGSWVMYDLMRDAVMLDMMMSHQGYYYGAQPMAPMAHQPVAVVHHTSFWTVIGWIFVILLIIVVLAALFRII